MRKYFQSKGKILTAREYKDAEDKPVRYVAIRRAIGPWSRLENMLGPIEFSEQEKAPDYKNWLSASKS